MADKRSDDGVVDKVKKTAQRWKDEAETAVRKQVDNARGSAAAYTDALRTVGGGKAAQGLRKVMRGGSR